MLLSEAHNKVRFSPAILHHQEQEKTRFWFGQIIISLARVKLLYFLQERSNTKPNIQLVFKNRSQQPDYDIWLSSEQVAMGTRGIVTFFKKVWIHNFIKINAVSCSKNNIHSNKTLFITDNFGIFIHFRLIKKCAKLGSHFLL